MPDLLCSLVACNGAAPLVVLAQSVGVWQPGEVPELQGGAEATECPESAQTVPAFSVCCHTTESGYSGSPQLVVTMGE